MHAFLIITVNHQCRLLHLIELKHTTFIFFGCLIISKKILSSLNHISFTSFSVGISVVLIDLPYDIMGIKLLWWTWHDTDPNIYDRHYWVPWTSYYFHSTFSSGMTFVFYGVHKLLAKNEDKLQSAG